MAKTIWQMKNAKSTLERQKSDLMDDSTNINSLNSKIEKLADEFREIISCPYSEAIASKLSYLKQPYQSNDVRLNSAANYIQNEINAISREIAQSEAIAKSNGGGAW